MKNKIIILDNDPAYASMLVSLILSRHSADYSLDIDYFTDHVPAQKAVKNADCVICDYQLNNAYGSDFIKQSLIINSQANYILISAFFDLSSRRFQGVFADFSILNEKYGINKVSIMQKHDFNKIADMAVSQLSARPGQSPITNSKKPR